MNMNILYEHLMLVRSKVLQEDIHEYTSIWCEHKFSILLLSGELLRIFFPSLSCSTPRESWIYVANVIHSRLVIASCMQEVIGGRKIIIDPMCYKLQLLRRRKKRKHFIVLGSWENPFENINRMNINY